MYIHHKLLKVHFVSYSVVLSYGQEMISYQVLEVHFKPFIGK